MALTKKNRCLVIGSDKLKQKLNRNSIELDNKYYRCTIVLSDDCARPDACLYLLEGNQPLKLDRIAPLVIVMYYTRDTEDSVCTRWIDTHHPILLDMEIELIEWNNDTVAERLVEAMQVHMWPQLEMKGNRGGSRQLRQLDEFENVDELGELEREDEIERVDALNYAKKSTLQEGIDYPLQLQPVECNLQSLESNQDQLQGFENTLEYLLEIKSNSFDRAAISDKPFHARLDIAERLAMAFASLDTE